MSQGQVDSMPLRVFYSYAHEDEALRAKLETALAPLRREGLIVDWHDRQIAAGANWAGEIDQNVRSAHLVLLLVSSDFLASDYVNDVEMRIALERNNEGTAIVVPIILRACDWSSAPFAKLQAVPKDGTPITSWPNQDEAFADVARGIRKVVTRFKAPPAGPSKPLVDEQTPRLRFLDAAIASHIAMGRSTELQMLVRLPDSPGLKGILDNDSGADAKPEDVQEKRFNMTFPVGPGGKPQPRRATVTVRAPEFEPAYDFRNFDVPADADSEQLSFLLRPLKPGRLTLVVELSWEEAVRGLRSLRTECVAEVDNLPPKGGLHVTQIPIEIGPQPKPQPPGGSPPGGGAPPGFDPPPGASPTGGFGSPHGMASPPGLGFPPAAMSSGYPGVEGSSVEAAPANTSGLGRSLPVLGVVTAAVVGVLTWAPWASRPDPINECLETVFKEKGAKSTPRKIGVSVAAVKDGKLDLSAEDSETIENRKAISDPVLLAAVDVCRARVQSTTAPITLKIPASMTVAVHRGNQERPQADVLVRVQGQDASCNTDDRGQCHLVVDGLKPEQKLVLTTIFAGVSQEHATTTRELLQGGARLVVSPQLPEAVVTLSDCTGKARLSGKVRFDGTGVFNSTCRNFDDASCREALLDHGEAHFRYDPSLATALSLNYYPEDGVMETFPIAKLTGDLSLRSKVGDCITTPPRQPCAPSVITAIKNEARGADGAFTGSFGFTLKDHKISVSGGSAAIQRQLNGSRFTSADCTGSLAL